MLTFGSADVDLSSPVDWGHPLNAGKVMWLFGLSGLSGGPQFLDLCGKNSGTLVNGPLWTPTGRGDAGLSFAGTNQYVSMPIVYPQVAGSSWSFGIWGKSNGSADRAAVGMRDGGGTPIIDLRANTATDWYFRTRNDAGNLDDVHVTVTAADHLFECYYESGAKYLYVDGVLAGTSSPPDGSFTVNAFNLGRDPKDGNGSCFGGTLGEFWFRSGLVPRRASDNYLHSRSGYTLPDGPLRTLSTRAYLLGTGGGAVAPKFRRTLTNRTGSRGAA